MSGDVPRWERPKFAMGAILESPDNSEAVVGVELEGPFSFAGPCLLCVVLCEYVVENTSPVGACVPCREDVLALLEDAAFCCSNAALYAGRGLTFRALGACGTTMMSLADAIRDCATDTLSCLSCGSEVLAVADVRAWGVWLASVVLIPLLPVCEAVISLAAIVLKKT